MTVGEVTDFETDFEMTLTYDLFNVVWENNDFVFKVSIPHKNWLRSSQNMGERSMAILALLFLDVMGSPPE